MGGRRAPIIETKSDFLSLIGFLGIVATCERAAHGLRPASLSRPA